MTWPTTHPAQGPDHPAQGPDHPAQGPDHPALVLPLPGAPTDRVAALRAAFPAQLAALAPAAVPALDMPDSFALTLAAALALDETAPHPTAAELLRRHYLSFLPGLRLDQARPVGPAGRVLHARFDWERAPGLVAAIDRLLRLLPADATAAWLGAARAADLLPGCPDVESLYRRTYYGAYFPLLYGFPADLQRLCVALDRGAPLEAVVEEHLTAPLVHELSHAGRRRDALFPPYLDECLASYLGAQALPELAFPREGGPRSLYGAPWLVQVGQALMRAAGPALTEAHGGARPFAAVLPPGLLPAVWRLGWDEYRQRREAHLLSSNYTPEPWLKLFTLAAAGALPVPESLSLADLAIRPWTDIPTPEEAPLDAEILEYGLRAMCLQNHLQDGTFHVTRSRPAGPIEIDLDQCVIRVAAPPGLAAAGPAPRYLFPPAVAARLRGRGLRSCTLTLTELPADAALPPGLVTALLNREAPGAAVIAPAPPGATPDPGYALQWHRRPSATIDPWRASS